MPSITRAQGRTRILQLLLVAVAAPALLSCGATTPVAPGSVNPHAARVADLQVVDCLLPPQVRRLGNMTYLSARRPTLTTAADCRVRGGEYVEYDRADYRSALAVWMPAAEEGDAEAQANVGEIFERGLGGTPNHAAAAIWYEKAAQQGNARARFNLGTLYEQGLGVEKDLLKALNLYRLAWGLPADSVMFREKAEEEKARLRQELQQQIDRQETQLRLMRRQIEELQARPDFSASNAVLRSEIEALQSLVDSLESQRSNAQAQVRDLAPTRGVAVQDDGPEPSGDAAELRVGDLDFGRYHALVIGNQNYQRIDSLQSPHRDIERIGELLRDRYGFQVQLIRDGSNITVMEAINDLNARLGDDDNLLIYYAGHGSRVRAGEHESGYWLPVNADPPPRDTFWVSNEFVTRHLARLPARRVLVIADSCYAGLLSSSPGYLFLGDDPNYSDDYIRYKLPRRARLLMASGGDSPVLDGDAGDHSVFAAALIDVLEDNRSLLAGPELFVRVRDRVRQSEAAAGIGQEPQYKTIKGAGHEVGDFFFVPRDISS